VEDQSRTIEFLSQASTYGIGEPVARRETHAAIVFLAGAFAYKLKRSVRYSYLDYSSIERRRAMCEAEFAINRKTTPDLYLSVQPIVCENGVLRFGNTLESKDAVDWVVVMRRFSQSELLTQKLEAGDVSAELFRELGTEIAQFHRRAELNREFGGASAIARTIAESAKQIGSFAGGPFDASISERLRNLSQSNLAWVAGLLDARRDSGFVRRCHGDLHLNNVCILNSRPVLFDAIELTWTTTERAGLPTSSSTAMSS
jgi:aminoglycoside phosphotransferase family enzyme